MSVDEIGRWEIVLGIAMQGRMQIVMCRDRHCRNRNECVKEEEEEEHELHIFHEIATYNQLPAISRPNMLMFSRLVHSNS